MCDCANFVAFLHFALTICAREGIIVVAKRLKEPYPTAFVAVATRLNKPLLRKIEYFLSVVKWI